MAGKVHPVCLRGQVQKPWQGGMWSGQIVLLDKSGVVQVFVEPGFHLFITLDTLDSTAQCPHNRDMAAIKNGLSIIVKKQLRVVVPGWQFGMA